MDVVDPDAIHAVARERCARRSASALDERPARGASRRRPCAATTCQPSAKGVRRLRTVALGLLAAADAAQAAALAKAQFDRADNMTDRQGALGILVSLDAPERQAALDAFYERFRDDAAGARQMVRAAGGGAAAGHGRPGRCRLATHPDFTIDQPQPAARAGRQRSAATSGRSTRADGRGYRFLADMILAADKLNPQIAARLVPPFGRWRRFEPKRAELMRAGAGADRRDARPVEGRVRAGEKSLA